MSAEFEQLVAQFEQFQSKIKNVDDQLAGVGQMQSELTELEVSASSADLSITVTAGPGGSVKDIQITDKALTRTPQELSSALMSTLQEAVAEAARKQATIVDEHMGGDLNTTEQVVQTQAELFGTSPEDLRARMEEARPARPAPPEEEYQEDYSQQDLFGDDDDQRPAPPPASGSGGSDPGGSAGDDFLKNLFDDDR